MQSRAGPQHTECVFVRRWRRQPNCENCFENHRPPQGTPCTAAGGGKNAMWAGVCMHGTRRSMQAQRMMARVAVLCSTNLHLKLILHVQGALEHGGLLLVKHPAAQHAQYGFSLHLSACPHSARCTALVRAGHRTGTAHRLPALPPTHSMAAALRRGRPAAPVLGWPRSPAAALLPPATLAPLLWPCPSGGLTWPCPPPWTPQCQWRTPPPPQTRHPPPAAKEFANSDHLQPVKAGTTCQKSGPRLAPASG